MAEKSKFTTRQCTPCRGGIHPLRPQEIEAYQELLGGAWRVIENSRLEKEFLFDDFAQALDFVVAVGELAEQQGHHPDLHLSWGRVKVLLWTHKIGGLHENDFILASKIDAL